MTVKPSYRCNMDKVVVAVDASIIILCSAAINCWCTSETSAQDVASSNKNQLFVTSFQNVVNKALLLTRDFDIEMQKWKRGEQSNETMVSITDSYVPRFKELINLVKDLQTPQQFENVTKLYLKSVQSELKSNIHYRNSLVSGNTTESLLSSKLYSDALRYEMESFGAFRAAEAKTDIE
jgi:hypothetical protein